MIPTLSVDDNRQLALHILDIVKEILSQIMDVLQKKKQRKISICIMIEMQLAGIFSEESNSDRLVSAFSTILNKK